MLCVTRISSFERQFDSWNSRGTEWSSFYNMLRSKSVYLPVYIARSHIDSTTRLAVKKKSAIRIIWIWIETISFEEVEKLRYLSLAFVFFGCSNLGPTQKPKCGLRIKKIIMNEKKQEKNIYVRNKPNMVTHPIY